MPDYSNSIIYKLCCKDTSITDIYVGSTTAFRARKCQHKTVCHNENDKKHNFNRKQLDICNSNICNDMILFEDILILRNKTCGNNIILFNLILNNNILIVDIETKYSDDYRLILYKDTIQINETIFYNYYENIYTYRYNLIKWTKLKK
jgi:hypothetical protein